MAFCAQCGNEYAHVFWIKCRSGERCPLEFCSDLCESVHFSRHHSPWHVELQKKNIIPPAKIIIPPTWKPTRFSTDSVTFEEEVTPDIKRKIAEFDWDRAADLVYLQWWYVKEQHER